MVIDEYVTYFIYFFYKEIAHFCWCLYVFTYILKWFQIKMNTNNVTI
jgi:hypothetical protein